MNVRTASACSAFLYGPSLPPSPSFSSGSPEAQHVSTHARVMVQKSSHPDRVSSGPDGRHRQPHDSITAQRRAHVHPSHNLTRTLSGAFRFPEGPEPPPTTSMHTWAYLGQFKQNLSGGTAAARTRNTICDLNSSQLASLRLITICRSLPTFLSS